MPILVKSDDVRRVKKGQASSWAVTGGTGVNGLNTYCTYKYIVLHVHCKCTRVLYIDQLQGDLHVIFYRLQTGSHTHVQYKTMCDSELQAFSDCNHKLHVVN